MTVKVKFVDPSTVVFDEENHKLTFTTPELVTVAHENTSMPVRFTPVYSRDFNVVVGYIIHPFETSDAYFRAIKTNLRVREISREYHEGIASQEVSPDNKKENTSLKISKDLLEWVKDNM